MRSHSLSRWCTTGLLLFVVLLNPPMEDFFFNTRTPRCSRLVTVSMSSLVKPVAFIHRARSASSNFSGCVAAYSSSSLSLSVGSISEALSRKFCRRAMIVLELPSPKMISSSHLPTLDRLRRVSVELICAAMLVCVDSLACASMNLGSDCTTFLRSPVVASPVSRALDPLALNSFAFSASLFSTAAMCSCLSSQNSGSCSLSTASLSCVPLFVSILYLNKPLRWFTSQRSKSIASYVHS